MFLMYKEMESLCFCANCTANIDQANYVTSCSFALFGVLHSGASGLTLINKIFTERHGSTLGGRGYGALPPSLENHKKSGSQFSVVRISVVRVFNPQATNVWCRQEHFFHPNSSTPCRKVQDMAFPRKWQIFPGGACSRTPSLVFTTPIMIHCYS